MARHPQFVLQRSISAGGHMISVDIRCGNLRQEDFRARPQGSASRKTFAVGDPQSQARRGQGS